jgi:anaphase-promoting complex subunit 2
VRESKTKIRIKYQESDLVSVLVNLYGSQEAFINEYQNMLAEKLMSAREYNIEDEITNIERLKMRFGEAALQTCNIIVKDVKDSKRLDR